MSVVTKDEKDILQPPPQPPGSAAHGKCNLLHSATDDKCYQQMTSSAFQAQCCLCAGLAVPYSTASRKQYLIIRLLNENWHYAKQSEYV